MNREELILISELSSYYKVERSLFSTLDEYGIIETIHIENTNFIHRDKIDIVEKVIRMHKDLDINMEGIDTVLHLLDKIVTLQNELNIVRHRLKLYE